MGSCCGKKAPSEAACGKGELDNEKDANVDSLALARDNLVEGDKRQPPPTPPTPPELTETAAMVEAALFTARSAVALNSATCRSEMSETIDCSSTTVDDIRTGRPTFHCRVETAASSTWPDVSMPTASVRYDHLPSVSEFDTEEDFSMVEGSTTSLRERRLAFRARERAKALLREFQSREGEVRRAIVELCNFARRDMAFRHHRGILSIERRGMLIAYFKERFVLLLRITTAQETLGRRMTEHEWQAQLLRKMQQHRAGRLRRAGAQGGNDTTEASSAACSDEEEAGLPAAVDAALTPTGGRPLSAPSSFCGKQLQQRRNLSLSSSPSPPGSQVSSGKSSARPTVSETGGRLQLEKAVPRPQSSFGMCQPLKARPSGAEKSIKSISPACAPVESGVGEPF
ncbi:uncharacterized protein Tco025E_06367 [Trypanosoma conorhini]|uniref:Uncharacterized protein n=1 Tax=Trypanosoma conorhini TaxID=83891 RepID=A0A422P5S3_9TRYP|nr:uncharacterized protein Tco025E_06367 [Trypanosoma conorhini]RNF13060.1 hypothetical protein Tco025E_06367 [Trypanosoma conorhini]